jgi:hypothetical protein
MLIVKTEKKVEVTELVLKIFLERELTPESEGKMAEIEELLDFNSSGLVLCKLRFFISGSGSGRIIALSSGSGSGHIIKY